MTNTHEQNAAQVRTQLETVEQKIDAFIRRNNTIFVMILAGTLYGNAILMFVK